MNYIWHCPGTLCLDKGTILFKTDKPFLLDGKIKCPNCGDIYSFSEIEKFNVKNIQTYLKK